ncbi:MAG: toxin-antitoxin system YwqK family antitoxin, partial [Bacteroidia bacterium]
SETVYKNNKKQGLEIIWYSSGCVKQETFYNNGVLDGPVTFYSRNCKKDITENFKNGVKEGLEISYHPTGRIKSEGNYKKGNLDGVYKVYNKNGEFSFESRSTETTADLKPDFSDTANNIAVRVFRRNKWNKKLIVADLTGSMYPFAQQISTWLKLHFLRDSLRQNFVFFNDGDNKRDDQKKIGVTGGVYYCTAKTMDQLVNAMNLTIRNGTGGDAPENVVEAILYGLKKNKNIDNVVLLADNWAKVRDLSLITRVKVPVHVLLCGVYDGMEINPDYLNIAYKTKGSIHTIEQDITDLMMQTSGKKFNINGVDYIIKNGTIRTY